MKKKIFYVLLFSFVVMSLPADILIKQTTHTDSYYYGGVERQARDTAESFWLGEDKIAYVTARRRVIVDDSKKIMTIIFTEQKTYAETPLPFDIKNLTEEETWKRMQGFQNRGTVQATEALRKIGQWNCRAYKATVDTPTPLEITYWAATDLPFEWERFRHLFTPVRKLANYSDDYIEALTILEGHPILIETTVFISGSSFKSVSRVVEISEKSPPSGIYSTPAGFKKKERLSIPDLRIR